MHKSKLIQHWGRNHLYLWNASAMTRVSTIDCSFKVVRETPINDYDLVTIVPSRVPTQEQAQAHLWMYGAFDHESLDEEKCIHNRALDNKEYKPKPFPKDLFKPLKWTHILVTLDVYTNDITQM